MLDGIVHVRLEQGWSTCGARLRCQVGKDAGGRVDVPILLGNRKRGRYTVVPDLVVLHIDGLCWEGNRQC